MTSVLSRLQLSSGSKACLTGLLLLLSGCAPKVVQTVQKTVSPPVVEKQPERKPEARFTEGNISLLIPFNLNSINLDRLSKAEVEQSAMAIDFYQGFKLGLDSAAASGLNFRLEVLDTRDDHAQLDDLVRKKELAKSHLIVGPVFPKGVKYISGFESLKNIPIVNPLAATHPEEFNNPNLVSVMNNIDLHVAKTGEYINKSYDPAKTVVVLINPKGADQVMADPVRKYFSDGKFTFQEYASVFTMELNIIKGKTYVIIVSSSDRTFVVPTIDKLIKMKRAGLNMVLYGHPDWVKQNYNIEKLQTLHTTLSSSYKVDYSDPAVNSFIRKYRTAYRFEPGEYAFKGFDIGYYFARLISKYKADYAAHIATEKYKGLHNSFSFRRDPKYGYINTSLMLLRYDNYVLRRIQ